MQIVLQVRTKGVGSGRTCEYQGEEFLRKVEESGHMELDIMARRPDGN